MGVGRRNIITKDQPLTSKCRDPPAHCYMKISLFICIVLIKVRLLVVSYFIKASQSQQMSEVEYSLCFIGLDLKPASPSKTSRAVV